MDMTSSCRPYLCAVGLALCVLSATQAHGAAAVPPTLNPQSIPKEGYYYLAGESIHPNGTVPWRVGQYNGHASDIQLGSSETLLVTAYLNLSFKDIGWDILRIGPSRTLLEEHSWQAYFAQGYLEGYLTYQQISDHYYNSASDCVVKLASQVPLRDAVYAFAESRASPLECAECNGKTPKEDYNSGMLHAFRMSYGVSEGRNAALVLVGETPDPYHEIFCLSNSMDMQSFFTFFNHEHEHWSGTVPPTLKSNRQHAATSSRQFAQLDVRDRQGGDVKQGSPVRRRVGRQNGKPGGAAGSPAPHHGRRNGLSFEALSNPVPLPPMMSSPNNNPPNITKDEHLEGSRCSAGVAITERGDIVFGHATWWTYSTLMKMHKTYLLETTVVFSSYPGYIHSSDDFVVTSHGIAVTETTNEVNGFELAARASVLADPSKVTTPYRMLAASVFAKDSATFVEILLANNSGTDAADWLVVDMKRYNASATTNEERLLDGFVHAVEIWPDPMSIDEDITYQLRDRGYISINNCPLFEAGEPLTGIDYNTAVMGRYWDCNYGPRPSLFRRMARNVQTAEDVVAVLRHNDYKRDPFLQLEYCGSSACSPAYSPAMAIACRRDLVDDAWEQGPIGVADLKSMLFGGLDAKVVNLTTMMDLPRSGSSDTSSWTLEGFNVTVQFSSGPSWIADRGPKGKQTPLPAWVAEDEGYRGFPSVFDFPTMDIPALSGWPSNEH